MASLECKIPENEPTLLFDEKGFTFFIQKKCFRFYPHLWIKNGDQLSGKEILSPNEIYPELPFGKVFCSIDRALIHPERTFHLTQQIQKSLSDLLSDYFEAIHFLMEGAFKSATHLNIIRPALYSREPSLEGLAIVRLKSALLRAGFPEKQKVLTVFEAFDLWSEKKENDPELILKFFTDSFSQFRFLSPSGRKKEIGSAKGAIDFKLFKPYHPIELKHPLLFDSLHELSHRSQLPFLKDSLYLIRASKGFSDFYFSSDLLKLGESADATYDPYFEENIKILIDPSYRVQTIQFTS